MCDVGGGVGMSGTSGFQVAALAFIFDDTCSLIL